MKNLILKLKNENPIIQLQIVCGIAFAVIKLTSNLF